MAEPGSNGEDPYDLTRFVDAQDAHGMYQQAKAELQNGRKVGHWIWFVFPQLAGLGMSSTSRRYAITGLDEARAYLAHPVLGPRLTESCGVLADIDPGQSAETVMGGIDAVKLRSSLSLFARAAPGTPIFTDLLDRFYGGDPDPRTDELLGRR